MLDRRSLPEMLCYSDDISLRHRAARRRCRDSFDPSRTEIVEVPRSAGAAQGRILVLEQATANAKPATISGVDEVERRRSEGGVPRDLFRVEHDVSELPCHSESS